MKYNMIWDGLFHVATWGLTFVGTILLARASNRSGSDLAGGMIAGWGVFNVLEGAIDHQLLGVHHVHPGSYQLAFDVGFIVLGALMVAGGALLAREQSGAQRWILISAGS